MIRAKPDHYQFTFVYWERGYALHVICAGIKLLFTGYCEMTINMHEKEDMAMMRAASEASKIQKSHK